MYFSQGPLKSLCKSLHQLYLTTTKNVFHLLKPELTLTELSGKQTMLMTFILAISLIEKWVIAVF